MKAKNAMYVYVNGKFQCVQWSSYQVELITLRQRLRYLRYKRSRNKVKCENTLFAFRIYSGDFNTSLLWLPVAHIVCFHTFLYGEVDDPLLKWISHHNIWFAMFASHQLGEKFKQLSRGGSKNSANLSYVWKCLPKTVSTVSISLNHTSSWA